MLPPTSRTHSYLPVPVRVTLPEFAGGKTATFNAPVLAPVVVGLNCKITVQLVPGARVPWTFVGQVPPAAPAGRINWSAFMPPSVIPVMVRVPVPVLLTVSV